MNNTTIINIFKSDNNNIAYIKTAHCQIMSIIANTILKFESVLEKPIVANHISLVLLLLARPIPSLISILS